MDYGPVVVHVFMPEQRDYYRLERLWGDVPRVELDLEGALSADHDFGVEPADGEGVE